MKNEENSDLYARITGRVSVISMICNLFLTSFKLAAGLIGHSSAMISDAVHSLSDAAGSLIVMIGAGASEKKADKEHPYGHERFECVASILLSFLLAIAGFEVAASAWKKISENTWRTAVSPGLIALTAAVVSIVVKEALFQYTMYHATAVKSVALRAEAWHHRSDALSSVGSLAGIAGARLGFPVLDPVAGLLISIFIFKSAYDVFIEAIDKMTDHACDPEMEKNIRLRISENPHVQNIDLLRTREFGRKVYVDLEVAMDASLSLNEAHTYAEEIHDMLETGFPEIKHVMVHVNPAGSGF